MHKFKIDYKISQTQCSSVFAAKDLENGNGVVIKMQKVDAIRQNLLFETKLLNYLKKDPNFNNKCIPTILYASQEGNYNVMVMECPSLWDLMNICGKKLQWKTVILLAPKMLDAIEFLHSKGFIHRDIKPQNFTIGVQDHIDDVYLIDYGLAKQYVTNENEHIHMKESCQFSGTINFASTHVQQRLTASRRDDLISLGYTLMYLVKGTLPWIENPKIKSLEGQKQADAIMVCKLNDDKKFLKGLPDLQSYLDYCQKIEYGQKPDYQFLRSIFQIAYQKEFNGDKNCHEVYDWYKLN